MTKVIDDKTVTQTAPPTTSARTAVLPVVEPAVYERGSEIARGGMGRIVEAIDLRLGRTVAIKEIRDGDPALALRFEREALISARLEHPAIVAIYEAGRWPTGEPFYAMKRVVGRPLDKVIAECTTLAERLALIPNVLAVFDALAYAHGQGVIHRDLKPSNVLVGAHGETVVIDWGLAKKLGESEEAATGATSGDETVAGAVLGTPAYMPPEQARAEQVDERADVYALGALLYYLLAGRAPFHGVSARSILDAVISRPPATVRTPGVPGDLATIVETAMARDPAERYPSAAALAEDLRRFQTGQLVGRHTYTLSSLLWRWVRRHRAVVAVATLLLVVSGVALAVAFDRIGEERDRAETDEAWERMQASQQIVARARTLLDSDPSAALDALHDVPLDAWENVLREAWLVAVATTSTDPPREVHVSPGSGYSRVFLVADGGTIAIRDLPAPPTERYRPPLVVDHYARGGERTTIELPLHDIDPVVTRDRERLVWRDGPTTWAWSIREKAARSYPFAASSIEALHDSVVALHGARGCEIVDLATARTSACPLATPGVAFDRATHTLSTIGPDGVRHAHVLTGNASDGSVFDTEPALAIAPDGRSFVFGVGSYIDPITVVGDIELAHLTTLPARYLDARFSDAEHAFVVTRNSVLSVMPHETVQVRFGARGFDFTAADISGDGRWAVVTGRHDLTLWNVPRFESTHLPATQPGDIHEASVAPDGRSVATTASDRSVRVWDLEHAGVDDLPLPDEADAFAVDGDRVVVTTQTAHGHILVAWSPGTFPIQVDVPHAITDDVHWRTTNGTSPPIAIAGDRVAVMMGDKLELVDLTARSHAELDVEGYPVKLAFSPDGTRLLAAGAKLQIWDVATHALSVAHARFAAWLGDGRLVTADRAVVRIGELEQTVDCEATALEARESRIVVGCANGTLEVLDARSRARTKREPFNLARTPIQLIAIDSYGAIAAAGSRPEVYAYFPGRDYGAVMFGESRAPSRLRWVNGLIEVSTQTDSWLWDPATANAPARLPSATKILLGDHLAFATSDESRVMRATLLPSRLALGLRAWVVARSR